MLCAIAGVNFLLIFYVLGGLLMKGKRILSAVLTTTIMICFLFTGIVTGDTASSISIELDKTTVQVGDIINASIKINNINNFMGYQIYIKYDPSVLQPVTVGANEDYTANTFLQNATILKTDSYVPLKSAQNDLISGVLNFSLSGSAKTTSNLSSLVEFFSPHTTAYLPLFLMATQGKTELH